MFCCEVHGLGVVRPAADATPGEHFGSMSVIQTVHFTLDNRRSPGRHALLVDPLLQARCRLKVEQSAAFPLPPRFAHARILYALAVQVTVHGRRAG